MKVPLSWLKEVVPGLSASPEEIGDRLTMRGLEVESISRQGGEGLEKVLTGELLEVKKHPNADKLTVCRVRTGAGPEDARQIVCGAKNHQAGDKVAVALPGAKLPNGAKIEKSKMRGEVSDGMLCSAKELGVGEDAAGIWILPPSTPVGRPLAEALSLSETVLEVGITPNRGDCLSVVGIGRELAAAFGLRLEEPTAKAPQGKEAGKRVQVALEDPEGCPLYLARVLEGVKVGPSPDWMARRLERSGIRPISNVVDVTNYVMLLLGQPLHAFDARQILGGRIVVRRARAGEAMQTLDGVDRRLDPDDLVIADAKRAVALAGVMGGQHSGIEADTATVVLESAWFDPGRVRRVSRRHGLHSESSHRFERQVDFGGVERASALAAGLIAELSGGKVVPGVVAASGGKPPQPAHIPVAAERVRHLLGVEIPPREIERLLASIGFAVKGDRVTVPSWRPDVTREVDLVEEVARLYGYEKVPAAPARAAPDAGGATVDFAREGEVRGLFASLGFLETVHLPFGDPEDPARLSGSPAESVRIANPLAPEQAVLRRSLLPALLRNLARQRAVRNLDVKVFELSSVFLPRAGALPEEPRRLAALLSGRGEPRHWSRPEEATVDFFDAKGAVEVLVRSLTGQWPQFSVSAEPHLVEGAQAMVKLGNEALGSVGQVHPQVLSRFGVEEGTSAFILELDYEALARAGGRVPVFAELPRFPAVERDVALVVDEGLEVGGMIAFVRSGFAKRGLESVEVFDLFRGGKLPQGKKSVALEMVYRSPDRTLTDDEVNSLHEKVVSGLVERFRAERRA